MRSPLRKFTALGAVLFAVAGLSACGGGLPGDAVVKVGSMPITTSTFDHWLTVAADSGAQSTPGAPKPAVPLPPDYTACVAQLRAQAPAPAKGQKAPTTAQFKNQCAQEYKGLRDQVLAFLITADWVLGEASDRGVSVTDAAVNKQFATVKAQQFPKPADLANFQKSTGQTVPDLLLRVKLDMLSAQLRTKVTKGTTNVTPAAISTYYNQHKADFAQPERRDLRLLLVKTRAQAQAALSAVRAGTAFSTEAKKVSIDPATKAAGGTLLGVAKGQEEKALDDAVFAAPLHTLSGPVSTPFGYYVFQVQKVTPGTQQTLAQASNTIKQQLVAKNQQTALDSFVKTFQTKWKGETDCRAGYVMMDCKQYKAPKGAAVTPTTAPGQ